jgi:hypothetical protein
MSELYTANHKWAFSAGGLPLELFKSAKKNTPNSGPILIIGGVHGDEPEGVWLAQHALEWLKSTPVRCPWLLIPCLNPDGFNKNERVNSNGVDLNRNFPADNWSNEHSQPRYYPGPSPASEPETQALAELISVEKPILIIHCHSWNPCVVYTGEPGRRDAERLSESCGYPAQPDIGYPTPGSLGEYGWRAHKTPVICIEEAERVEKDTIWPRFKRGFEAIFDDVSPRC